MRLHTRLRYAPAEVDVEKRADGATLLRSPQALKPYARAVGEWLVQGYEKAPDRVLSSVGLLTRYCIVISWSVRC